MMKRKFEKEIQELLSEMTLEEKIGQLRQCGPSLVGAFEVSFGELLNMMFDGKISHEEFDRLMSTAHQDYREEDIRNGRIGSFNGIGDIETANRLQKIAVEESRLGIPLLFGYDVIHGFRTVFPIPLAESCSWDEELWEQTAEAAAAEAGAAGIHMTFAPMVDVAKDARWGRISEGAGEDVLMNSLFGAAKTKGFQKNGLEDPSSIVACVKHFAAYGAVEAGKDYNRVDMSLQRLREEYLPAYEACIKAGARAIMPAFNDINGIPCSANKMLMRDILREEWGFDGLVVSDANAIRELVSHGIAEDEKEAARMAIEAQIGLDMSSDTYKRELKDLVEAKIVSEEVVNEAVSDVLEIKYELGLFERPYRSDKQNQEKTLLNDSHRALARKAAEESIVLLKNDGNILPLSKETKIGLFGRLAEERGQMTGAWAIGSREEDCASIIDGFNAGSLSYEYDRDGEHINKIAESADVLIVAVGENKDDSGEAASRADITLKKEDLDLIDRLVQTGKPVVVILFNGRPLAIPEVKEKAAAILEAWHPGTEAGNALYAILFGDVNPSGKLTTTFPAKSSQCPIYYAHYNTGRPGARSKFSSKYLDAPLEPLYRFGYGLSYNTYAYENIDVHKLDDRFSISFDVRNEGDREGDEIVQCYVQQIAEKRIRPIRELKRFSRIHLGPKEVRRVEYVIPIKELQYYDQNMELTDPSGIVRFYCGGDSDGKLMEEVRLSK